MIFRSFQPRAEFTIVMTLLINASERDRCDVYGNNNIRNSRVLGIQKSVGKRSSERSERCVLNNSNASSHANNRDLLSVFGIEEVSTDRTFCRLSTVNSSQSRNYRGSESPLSAVLYSDS